VNGNGNGDRDMQRKYVQEAEITEYLSNLL
jgi:hypothetical protein